MKRFGQFLLKAASWKNIAEQRSMMRMKSGCLRQCIVESVESCSLSNYLSIGTDHRQVPFSRTLAIIYRGIKMTDHRMLRLGPIAALLLIVTLLSSCALFPPALDVSGKWTGDLIYDAASFPMELQLVQTGTSLSGHMTVRLTLHKIAIPIQTGSIDKSAKTISITTDQHVDGDQYLQFTLYGDCNVDDYMSGTGSTPSGVAFTWYASRL